MEFIWEFYSRGKLSKNVWASFIALILKKDGAECLKDFKCSMHKILAKVLAGGLDKVLPSIISSN